MGRSSYRRRGKQHKSLSGASSSATFLSSVGSGSTSTVRSDKTPMIQPAARSQSGGFQTRGGGDASDGVGWDVSGRATLSGNVGRRGRGPAAWVTYGLNDSVSGPNRISRDPVGVISRGKIRAVGSSRFERVQRNRVIFLLILAAMAGLILYQLLLAG